MRDNPVCWVELKPREYEYYLRMSIMQGILHYSDVRAFGSDSLSVEA
jgi:hypothetical protein